jgi:outer membrane receptor for ferrienterochelin and colicins
MTSTQQLISCTPGLAHRSAQVGDQRGAEKERVSIERRAPRLAKLGFGPLALFMVFASIPLRAQTVDHTAFEQMFGEPVTTSATGKPQRASEVPVEMEIVTADDIRRSGATNIPDVLRFVAGLDVRQYGMQDAAVGIRGYNTALNPRVLVLLDGRQVYQDDYGMTVWPLIPVVLSAIRQIEIIKGPNSALYGFNAVSGVINIVTYDPLLDKVNGFRAAGGSLSESYGEAVATAQVPGQLGVRLSANGFRSTEFEGTQGYAGREQPHSGTVAIDARAQLAPGVEWDLSGSIGSVDSDYYIDFGAYFPIGFKANSVRSRLSADTGFGVLSLDIYRNENRISLNEALFSTNWREDVTVVQLSDLIKLGHDNTVRVAAEYRDNSVSSGETFGGRVGYNILAGSIMWDWQILPSVSLTNAVRVDDLSLNHQGPQFEIPTIGGVHQQADIVTPSFNSGLVVKVSEYDTIRLTAARAVQLPSLVDLGVSQVSEGVIIAGNSGLRPSAVQNYEIDYDRRLPSLGAILRFAAFAQNTDPTIGSPFGSGLILLPNGQAALMARNFGSSSELGGEIGLKGSTASGIRWNLSYALAAVHDNTPESQLNAVPSVSYQRQTPTHAVILGVGYTWHRVEIDTQARWQSQFQDYALDVSTFTAHPVLVPNYITLNVRVAYRINDQVTVSGLAEQLNQHSIAESAGLEVERRFIGGVEVKF